MNETKTVKALSKEEVIKNQISKIPGEVIEVVNKLLTENYEPNNGTASIHQDDILNLLSSPAYGNHSRRDVFDNHWLDFEDIYREKGWKVTYVKATYDDEFASYFKFE